MTQRPVQQRVDFRSTGSSARNMCVGEQNVMNSVTWLEEVVHFSPHGRDSLTFRVFGLFEIETVPNTDATDTGRFSGMVDVDRVRHAHRPANP